MKRFFAILALASTGLPGCAIQPETPVAGALLSDGAPGRIAFVSKDGRAGDTLFRLCVVEAGESQPKVIAQSRQVLMSPRWSPDGRQIAFVGFERGKGGVFVQTFATGELRKVLAEAGAPAWSPDGTKLAVSINEAGNRDIYVISLVTGALARITTDPGIDTEPAWSPDGRSLAFTSDRDGTPKVYRAALDDPHNAVPLLPDVPSSFEPSYSPDGKKLLFTARSSAGFTVELMDLDTKVRRPISDGPHDDEPEFSPDGSAVIFATRRDAISALEVRALDGSVRKTLRYPMGLWSPTWAATHE